MRLQKFLSSCGVASRRKSEALILAGKVRVNGTVIRELGVSVCEGDIVEYDGKILKQETKVIYKMYKPVRVLSSVSDDRGRKCVTDFYHGRYKIYPIGRLDYMSEGLILLTNDGELANRLMHPRYGNEKRYLVHVSRNLRKEEIHTLTNGVVLDGYKTRKIKIEKVLDKQYLFTLKEGRNRQIRKMLSIYDIKVLRLIRTSDGGIELGDLNVGEIRELTAKEKEMICL